MRQGRSNVKTRETGDLYTSFRLVLPLAWSSWVVIRRDQGAPCCGDGARPFSGFRDQRAPTVRCFAGWTYIVEVGTADATDVSKGRQGRASMVNHRLRCDAELESTDVWWPRTMRLTLCSGWPPPLLLPVFWPLCCEEEKRSGAVLPELPRSTYQRLQTTRRHTAAYIR